MTLSDLKELVEVEGLETAIIDYCDGEEIEDPRMRKAWMQAHKHLTYISERLGEVELIEG